MNDLTKEELKEIVCIIREYTPNSGEMYPIFNKLKSMIDNYCEHDLFIRLSRNGETSIICSRCELDIKK